MCGIVGFQSLRHFNVLKDTLPQATARLSHRGPDSSGAYFDPDAGVGLGHARLSIIDLSSAGHQPMISDDGDVIIAYNGEIYNFIEIRKILEKLGHIFKSATDTEVVLKAYLEWGTGCLEKFIGMFAISIWDRRNHRFFLARDRLGIKPLFYYFNKQTFLFASELKALLAFKSFEREIDKDAMPLFLHYQYIPAPKTVFVDTYKLSPGHFLIFDGKTISTEPYWNIPGRPLDDNNTKVYEKECLKRLDDLLTTAVSDRLISDVPLGALLSGGIDSSIVVALMQKVNRSPVQTFSIGFKEPGYNEAPWASKVAEHLGTDHNELYVTPKDVMDLISSLPEIYDEPFADASAIPTTLVCRFARSKLTVALSGDGGDEQFSGYVRYWSTRALSSAFQRLPQTIKTPLSDFFERIPSRWIERCYHPLQPHLPQRFRAANFIDKWEKVLKLMRKSRIQDLYRMTVCLWPEEDILALVDMKLPFSRFEETFLETQGWPVLSRLMRVDLRTYLPDAMLTKVDRASMANSLEVRVPLLDHRVVEFTSKLPESLKYRNGSGKYLLKKLLAQYVPMALFERPKMGFGVPIDLWFRKDLKTHLLDYLSPERLKREGRFNHVLVEQKIKEHLAGQKNHQYRLWSILMWEMWRERWLDT
jgi:asparagine synthase (glutamine-hydrolysing)